MNILWQNNQVFNESGLFIGSNKVKLMFNAKKIKQVTLHSLGTIFTEGVDYSHNEGDNFITRLDNSSIPYFPEEAIHPTENVRLYPDANANAISNAVNGKYLLFNNKDFFAKNQVDISYEAIDNNLNLVLDSQIDRLPKLRKKLLNKEPIKITLIGDSISAGYNATKFIDVPPFMPCYMELVASYLGENITLQNRAISGNGIQHAKNVEQDYLNDKPDLLVIAYGMNNFAKMPIEEFLTTLQSIIDNCQATLPDTEYLIVNSMSGNPLWIPTVPGNDEIYANNIRSFVAKANENIALADVAKAWKLFLTRKNFYDLTGNGVNHPNDYGHRIYASVILELLTNKKFF